MIFHVSLLAMLRQFVSDTVPPFHLPTPTTLVGVIPDGNGGTSFRFTNGWIVSSALVVAVGTFVIGKVLDWF